MGFLNNFLALTLVCLVLSSLLVFSIIPTGVNAASKLSVPQFNVKLVDNSYDVPSSTTTSKDPYTGKETAITNPKFHVEKYDIEVTIKNQPFTPYTNTDGYECTLYYDVQVKPSFDENWRSFSSYYPFTNIEQSSSKETIMTYTLSENGGFLVKPPSGGQLDFRVEAFTGYWRDPTPQESASGVREQILTREASSGWSKIQTLTIPDNSPQLPSQTATQPENSPTTPDNNQPQTPAFVSHTFFLLCVGALFVGVIVAVVLVFTKHYTP